MISDHMHQDIARSSYADMLNDDERNRAYNNAIELCVNYLVTSKEENPNGNRFFKCCDIGTGSGLLSMMIVRSFKRLNYHQFHVTAFEAFQPMAECAKKVIEQNNMSEHISVIPARSDQHKFEQHPQFDLLVAELLDTELIGEGCLEVYRHAVQYLCSPRCLYVPHEARIYLEPVASARLFSRHAIDDLKFDLVYSSSGAKQVKSNITLTKEIRDCPGMPEIDDMQASALREGEDFTRFSRPQQVFDIVFGDLESLRLSDYKKFTFALEGNIDEPPVLVMWWDIIMYNTSLIRTTLKPKEFSWEILSCAPNWARTSDQLARDQFIKETYGREVWREHWIQGVYYMSSVAETRALVGSTPANRPSLTIHAYHDAYSMWFDLRECQEKLPKNCDCGVHRKLSRSQLAYLSDAHQMSSLIRSTTFNCLANMPEDTSVEGKLEFHHQREEALGDTVMTTSSGSEPKWRIRLHTMPNNTIELVDLALAGGEIPWSYSMMRYLADHQANDGRLPEPVESFEIKFTQVQFDNLNRIRTNIHTCEGFNLGDLDDMINYSSKYVDKELESHYLWEYPCTRLDSADYVVFSSTSSSSSLAQQQHDSQQELNDDDDNYDSDDTDDPPMEQDATTTTTMGAQQQRDKINSGTYWRHFRLPINAAAASGTDWQKGWALAFWLELRLKHTGQLLSLGPTSSIDQQELGKSIEWNKNCKQLVYFLHDHPLTSMVSAKQQQQHPRCIHLDVGLNKCQLMVQRAVDYNTSPLKSKRSLDTPGSGSVSGD